MAFETIDYNTHEGAKLRRILVDRANQLSRRLEDPSLSDRDTALTRGALGEVRNLLASPVAIVPLQSYSNHPRGIA